MTYQAPPNRSLLLSHIVSVRPQKHAKTKAQFNATCDLVDQLIWKSDNLYY